MSLKKIKKKIINADLKLKRYTFNESSSESLDASEQFLFKIAANATSSGS